MVQLIEDLHSVNINNVPQYTLPIATTTFGNYYYEGSSFGDVVFPVEPNDQQIIDQFLGISASTSSLTGKPLPSPQSVTVNVINGSGISGQASVISNSLQALGFNVVGALGSAAPVSSEAQETVVYYASVDTEPYAQEVANQLGGSVILSQDSAMVTSGSIITVVTGNDLSAATASSSSSTNSTSSTSSAPQAPVSPATTGLEAASSATQPLSAWDPRACTD
jgi:hypothetical protein